MVCGITASGHFQIFVILWVNDLVRGTSFKLEVVGVLNACFSFTPDGVGGDGEVLSPRWGAKF